MTDDIEKLVAFGQMALEQGWYDQARDYFRQALELGPSNREAMKGLARANEILSRSRPMPVEPTQVEPVKPPRKVATKPTWMYGLAAILVLAVVALVWIAYSMFTEPRKQATVVSKVAATPTETPMPTPTLKPLPTPTGKPPVPTLIPTPTRKPTKTPVPPTLTPVPPTLTPEISYEEAVYLLAVTDAPDCFANAEVELKLLIQEMARNPYVRGDRSWQKDVATAKASFFECFFRLKELNPPPRLADTHYDLVECGKFGLLAHDNYMFAIEELVPEAIEYGDEDMKEAADCFEQVFDEIDEILGL
jgi:tetratricopeptide (TPR) repeat protein